MARMSVGDAIDKFVDESMRVGEQIGLATFVKHISVMRWDLDDGAVIARLNWMAKQPQPRLAILTLDASQPRPEPRVVKRLR